VTATVNTATRIETSSNHSATHLLHAALRNVLGTHVAQKGSLVNDEQLRFDFSHFAKITDEEIAQVEAIVNEKIRENIPVVIKEMNKDEAVALGAPPLAAPFLDSPSLPSSLPPAALLAFLSAFFYNFLSSFLLNSLTSSPATGTASPSS
jgi:hypothetical protein